MGRNKTLIMKTLRDIDAQYKRLIKISPRDKKALIRRAYAYTSAVAMSNLDAKGIGILDSVKFTTPVPTNRLILGIRQREQVEGLYNILYNS